jgi:L-threonylcarbamoyladenylate synthase
MGRLCKVDPEGKAISAAAGIIRTGGVIAYPTETFYGLGADPFDRQAVERIFRIKKRPAGEPILLLIPSFDALPSLVKRITPLAERLMAKFWPGPLTLVLEASDKLPDSVTGGTGSVGVRLSSHPTASLLLKVLGQALTATSANRSGGSPAQSAADVLQAFVDGPDLILDGGRTAGGLPSTVVDARGERPRIIREGQIASTELASALA